MWAALPSVALVFWALFSFLYLSEESEHSTISIKTTDGKCYERYLNHDYSYLLDLELTTYLLSVQDLQGRKIPLFQVVIGQTFLEVAKFGLLLLLLI